MKRFEIYVHLPAHGNKEAMWRNRFATSVLPGGVTLDAAYRAEEGKGRFLLKYEGQNVTSVLQAMAIHSRSSNEFIVMLKSLLRDSIEHPDVGSKRLKVSVAIARDEDDYVVPGVEAVCSVFRKPFQNSDGEWEPDSQQSFQATLDQLRENTHKVSGNLALRLRDASNTYDSIKAILERTGGA